MAETALPQIISKEQVKSLGLKKRAARLRGYRKRYPERFKEYEKNRKSHAVRGKKEKHLAKTREWRKNNPDKVAAMKRRYYQKYKDLISKKKKAERLENPALVIAKRKKYVNSHKGLILEINKRSRLKDPLRTRENKRRHNLRHPDKVRARRHNRKAKLRGCKGIISAKLTNDLMDKQKNTCVYCKSMISSIPKIKEKKAHLDHKMPICLGGAHSIENLQWLCETCNLSKGGLHPDEWDKKIRLLF